MRKVRSAVIFVCLISVLAGCGSPMANEGQPGLSDREPSGFFAESELAGRLDEAAADMENSKVIPAQEGQEQIQNEEENGVEQEEMSILMKIGDEAVTVEWEDNESVRALSELLIEQPLSIQMSMYGGFEQVGSFGTSLPRNDKQTTTQAGDIVLYSGSQIVVFYGSNSWAYTRLGRITGKSNEELEELLGSGDVTITLEEREEYF